MARSRQASSLQEFKATLKDWKSLGPYLFLGGTGLPLADFFLHFGPMWPSEVAAAQPLLTGIGSLLTFHWIHDKCEAFAGRWIIATLIACVLFGTGYFVLTASRTIVCPEVKGRLALGFSLNDTGKHILEAGNQLPDAFFPRNESELLCYAAANKESHTVPSERAFDYYPALQVWAVRALLLVGWSLSFVALSSMFMAFIILHRRKTRGAWQH